LDFEKLTFEDIRRDDGRVGGDLVRHSADALHIGPAGSSLRRGSRGEELRPREAADGRHGGGHGDH
jgi:hypothetical protein